MRVDFHSHTLASDGELDAAALRALQRAAGTALMAITDHDTLAGYDACRALPPEEGAPQLVSGIELTASHEGREYHVVGLRFDADDPAFRAAVAAQQQRRRERAEGIAAALDYLGIPGSLEAATRIAAGAALGRPHFARFLVETGRVNSIDKAFDRYLGRGKPAGPKTDWPPLAAIVGWLHAAGGVAVLAHPLSYELGRAQIKKLIAAFAAAAATRWRSRCRASIRSRWNASHASRAMPGCWPRPAAISTIPGRSGVSREIFPRCRPSRRRCGATGMMERIPDPGPA